MKKTLFIFTLCCAVMFSLTAQTDTLQKTSKKALTSWYISAAPVSAAAFFATLDPNYEYKANAGLYFSNQWGAVFAYDKYNSDPKEMPSDFEPSIFSFFPFENYVLDKLTKYSIRASYIPKHELPKVRFILEAGLFRLKYKPLHFREWAPGTKPPFFSSNYDYYYSGSKWMNGVSARTTVQFPIYRSVGFEFSNVYEYSAYGFEIRPYLGIIAGCLRPKIVKPKG